MVLKFAMISETNFKSIFTVETKKTRVSCLGIMWSNPTLKYGFLQTIQMIAKMTLVRKAGQMKRERIQTILTIVP